MLELTKEQVELVNGGIHFKLIELVVIVIGSTIAGGPVGLGLALSGIVMKEGLENLNDMHQTEQQTNQEYWF